MSSGLVAGAITPVAPTSRAREQNASISKKSPPRGCDIVITTNKSLEPSTSLMALRDSGPGKAWAIIPCAPAPKTDSAIRRFVFGISATLKSQITLANFEISVTMPKPEDRTNG